jgi:hypothetical protein
MASKAQPRAHRRVADHRHRLALATDQRVTMRDAERGARGRACVAHRVDVIGGLEAIGETAEAILLSQRVQLVTTPGQDLVRVALVAHVEDEAIVFEVEDVVERDAQLDGAHARAEVASRHGHDVHDVVAHLVRHLRELLARDALEVVGPVDLIEELIRHGEPPEASQASWKRDAKERAAQGFGVG